MTHTEVLELIRHELNENGIYWDTVKELFGILMPEERFDEWSSKWYYWHNKEYKKMKVEARNIIQRTIGFDGNVWDMDDRSQLLIIRDAVRDFARPHEDIDLSGLFPENTALTQAQATLLLQIKNTDAQQAVSVLDKHPDFLTSTPSNQNFLLELLSLLYAKGLYDTLDERVFPALLAPNADSRHVKILHAHTLGSTSHPDYLRAALILEEIESDSSAELLELKTGAISNIRRYYLEKEDITKPELTQMLSILSRYYTQVFEAQNHHYYPGTNLAYMLKLSQLISPDAPQIEDDDIERIYTDAKSSIAKGSHSSSDETRYYAMISEVEFRLLTDHNTLLPSLTTWLDHYSPSPAYVERSMRMMRFFVRTVERFAVVDGGDILDRFAEVMEVMEGYVRHTA